MSVCSPALSTKLIPSCTQEVVIGTIAATNAALAVVIKDITTGRLEVIQGTSDSAGLITIDISEHKFAENHSYELFVFLASNNFDDREEIIISGVIPYLTYDTIALRFTDVYENTDEQFPFTSITLEAA